MCRQQKKTLKSIEDTLKRETACVRNEKQLKPSYYRVFYLGVSVFERNFDQYEVLSILYHMGA